ncbi:MAG: FISUMP domain-containing protein [Candidatus Falkowbacteria bacterium]
MLNKNRKSAFTLIELLVVIAIIGILATIAVVALQNARAKARDARRIADVKQIQTALELFFNDQGRYPTTAEFGIGSIYSTTTNGTTSYMVKIPTAPTPNDNNCSTTDNVYKYSSFGGADYSLNFCLGGPSGSLRSGVNNASPTGIAYVSPGSIGSAGVVAAAPSCSCTDAAVACCDNCDPVDAVCAGGTYCARDANCNGGSCIGGTCTAWACGSPTTISTVAGHTCNTGAPDYDTCTYDTMLIGSQCWMRQSLNVGTIVTGATSQTNNSLLEKYCYNNDSAICQSDGALYQWNEMAQYSMTESGQGICPTGWHVPSQSEWGNVYNSYNGYIWNTNQFHAVAAGAANWNGSAFVLKGAYFIMWTSTVANTGDPSTCAYYFYSGGYVGYECHERNGVGVSVRCIKNQ